MLTLGSCFQKPHFALASGPLEEALTGIHKLAGFAVAQYDNQNPASLLC